MRMLLVSLCHDSLSELEFVKPIARILSKHDVNTSIKHYMEISLEDISPVEKVIVCGSALKDEEFLRSERFKWLEKCDKPVLCVGLGFQAVAKAFGCNLFNRTKIGVFNVKLVRDNVLIGEKRFHAFFLTRKAASISRPLETLAKTGTLDCMIKHGSKDIYGCLFHPEVTRPEIILNFALRI